MSSLPEDIDPKDMPPGTKIWYYVRHSPGDNQTIDSQVAAIMRLVKEKGWLITREFKDESRSGVSTRNRKAFELMIHLARQKPRQADMLIVWEFSRFARNQVDSQFHRAELRRNGWKLLSMKDDIPKSPISPIFEALIDWKNEQFIIDLRANTKRGLRYIAEQGCVPVGPVAKGYTYQGKQIGVTREGVLRLGRKPEPDPEVAPLVVTAFEMKAVGAPYEVIAQKTSLYPAKSGSWHSFFHNRVYIGEYEFDGEVFRTIYPPLISTVLFEAVQKHLPQRQRKFTRQHHPRRKGSTYFLVDVAVCGYCGQPMEGKSANGYRYYVCSQRNHTTDLCPQAQLMRADELEAEVIQILRQHILSAEYLTGLLTWTNEVLSEGTAELQLRVEATQRELVEANQMALKMARNFALMERPTRSAELLLREQDERAVQLQTTLIGLEYELAHSRIETTPEEIKDYVNRTQSLLQRAEFFDLREVCGQLCARICGFSRARWILEDGMHSPGMWGQAQKVLLDWEAEQRQLEQQQRQIALNHLWQMVIERTLLASGNEEINLSTPPLLTIIEALIVPNWDTTSRLFIVTGWQQAGRARLAQEMDLTDSMSKEVTHALQARFAELAGKPTNHNIHQLFMSLKDKLVNSPQELSR